MSASSAISFGALSLEPNLVDALAESPDLVTSIPSTYCTTWDEKERADPALGPVLSFLHGGWDRAKEKKIGITAIYTGVFEHFVFEIGFNGCPLKQNLVWANKAQLQNRYPITLMEHLGHGIARLATSSPHSIGNTEHSFVTHWVTGEEIADLYTKINAKPAEIKDFTAKDREEFRADEANFGAAKVGYWEKREADEWGYESDGRMYDRSYKAPGIEEVAKRYA